MQPARTIFPTGGAAPKAVTPIVSARGLTKTYSLGEQSVRALRDVSLDIMPGEFVAVMGPSGSGKSTLLNMIGALDTPTSGRLLIDGADVATMSHDELAELRNRSIGFVFQHFNLLNRTSAVDNVMLPLLYAANRPANAGDLARRKLTDVGLGERFDNTPSQLSGGQQQRVAIARALVTEPRMILADEPTGALDTETSIGIMNLLTGLNASGLTIVVVTHEPDIAAYAGRLLRFRDGMLVDDIRQQPRAMEAAS